MKAVICSKYGPPEVLKIRDVEKPVPKDNEVCIKIHSAGVTNSDVFIRGSQLPFPVVIFLRIAIGIRKPRKEIIGIVQSGEIESIGKNIKRFKVGDQVFGLTGFNLGTYAEYKCVQELDSKSFGCIALKPENLNYEEATVAAYGGLLALQYMEKGNIKPGHKVLIYGASGTTGTIAVQYAKYLGAEVTGVCSTSNIEMVKTLGADEVLDYTKQETLKPGTQYDFMLDAVGKSKTSKLRKACENALAPNGIFSSIDDGDLKLDSERLIKIKELVEQGYIKPVLDRIYPMEQIVEAHRYVEQGHKRGGVAISIPG